MILKTDKFRENCTIIKAAIDNKNVSLYSETLELNATGNVLNMNVTNREYYVTVSFNLEEAANFKAAVNAKLFLDLISKITSNTIDIDVVNDTLKVKGNGEYKLPLIYNNNVMLELPKIEVNNVSTTMNIKSKDLQSILQFNSKELQRGTPAKLVQTYYYVDEKGCITFTSGACVNSFTLSQPIKMLLSEKVVKLFKLFKDVDEVSFKKGYENISGVSQDRVVFSAGNVVLSAILADSNMITQVPVAAIRNMASQQYANTITLNREQLLQALTRLMLFNNDKNYGNIEFSKTAIKIQDWSKENVEVINLDKECDTLAQNYSVIVNMNNLSLILNGCTDEMIDISFGDNKSICIKKDNVTDIIPELKLV